MIRTLTTIAFLCALNFDLVSQSDKTDWVDFSRKQFEEFFEIMNEPKVLSCDSTHGANGTIRFTWLPSFDNPISITIYGKGRDVYAVGKFYDLEKPTIYSSLKSIRVDTLKISFGEWREFRDNQLHGEAFFWFLPEDCINPVSDGASWLIEGVTRERSNKVHLMSPREESSIFKACLYLTSLFGFTELY